MPNALRALWAWFLWDFLERWPAARDWVLFARGKVSPIFVDYRPESRPRYGFGRPCHPLLEARIAGETNRYRRVLRGFLRYRERLHQIPRHPANPTAEPYWDNCMLPPFDGVAIYAFVASLNPRRYFEIGSGHSTRFARRAIGDWGLRTCITSFDPSPLIATDAICDTVVRERLEDVDPLRFRLLEAGDILFIDGSHRCLPNSDVTVAFLDILPYLRDGVVVGFHDINLPWDYPPDVARRYYSEQYLLATLLLAARGPAILLAGLWASRDRELGHVLDPVWHDAGLGPAETAGSSFWMLTGAEGDGSAGAGPVLDSLAGAT